MISFLTKRSILALLVGAACFSLAAVALVPAAPAFAQAPSSGDEPAAASEPAASTPTTDSKDKGFNPFSLEDWGKVGIAAVLSPVALVSFAIFSFTKFLVWVAGVVFNWSVAILVFEFSKYLGNSPGMLLAWSILRDLGNILLLFGFVSIGIRMILNVGHFSGGKALSQLIIFAVLLNFSLFAAEAVVDISNGMTLALYDQSVDQSLTCSGDELQCLLNNGLSGQILGQGNIISVVDRREDIDLVGRTADYLGDPIASIMKYLTLSILVATMAMVLFAGAILLVTRGITLAFLLVTSPIGFAGMAIPELEEYAKRWWKTLINNALFAPVFIVLLFVSLRLTDGLKALVGEKGVAAAVVSGGALDAGPIFLFLMVIGFMIASLIAAKNFSIMGANYAVKTAGGLTYGSMGFIGRRTLGRTALRAAEGMRKTSFARTGMGRLVVGGLDSAGKGNYDFRSNKQIGGLLNGGAFDKKMKLDLGHAQHGGYEHIVHETEDNLVKYGKKLKNTADEEAKVAKLNADKAHAQGKDGEVARLKGAQKRFMETRAANEKLWNSETASISKDQESINQQRAKEVENIRNLERDAADTSKGPGVTDMNLRNLAEAKTKFEAAEVDRTKKEAELKTRADAVIAQQKQFEKEAQAHANAVAEAEKELKNLETATDQAVKKLAPEAQFAEQLNREWKGNPLLWPTVAPKAYGHAAEKLSSWAKKSKQEREQDTFIAEIKKGLKKDDHAEKLAKAAHGEEDDGHGGGGKAADAGHGKKDDHH